MFKNYRQNSEKISRLAQILNTIKHRLLLNSKYY